MLMYINKPIKLVKFISSDNSAMYRDFDFGNLNELPSKTFTVDDPEDIKCCHWGFHAAYKEGAWRWAKVDLPYYIVEVWGLVDYDESKVSAEHMRFIEYLGTMNYRTYIYHYSNQEFADFLDVEERSSFINYKLPYRFIKAWTYKLGIILCKSVSRSVIGLNAFLGTSEGK